MNDTPQETGVAELLDLTAKVGLAVRQATGLDRVRVVKQEKEHVAIGIVEAVLSLVTSTNVLRVFVDQSSKPSTERR